MNVGRDRLAHRRPSIVGLRVRETQADIVDLDSFVSQHYKAKEPRLADPGRVKRRTLQRKEEQEPAMELDTGLGMMALKPLDMDFDDGQERRIVRKRELAGRFFDENLSSQRGRLMSVLSIGFSRVDVSLCVILYLLSTVSIFALYVFMSNRLRLKRAKVGLL